MSQRRMIYAKIFASHDLNTLSVNARYLYIGTLVLADDEGRLNADSRYLKGQIFSYDESVVFLDVSKWLMELEKIGILTLYQSGGSTFIQHPNWAKYQYIRNDRKSESKIPAPSIPVNQKSDMPQQNTSKVKEKKGKGIAFESFWNLYPKKSQKKKSEDKWNALTLEIQDGILKDLSVRIKTVDWTKEKGRYVPMPTTYLNGERWNDEIKIEESNTDNI